LILPVSILLAWELVTRFGLVKPLFMPAPEAVGAAFYDMLAHEGLLGDFWTSASVVAEGFLIGATGGLLAGILAGLSKTAEQVLGPLLDSVRQVPALAWFPLIVLWVGIGGPAKIVIISKTVFFPVFLNTLQGIRAVPREYIEVARVFNYSKGLLLRRVILPAASPSIFVGLRYGAGLAWAFIIAAEMLGGRYGLGYLLTRAQDLLLTDQLFVVILVIGLVGFSVDAVFRVTEKHVLRWKRGFEG
jgi:sulfonate transport system permease protein